MAEDISTLVLSVKSDGIKEGTNQLDALTKAADRAEASTKKLGTATAAANVENKSATATAQAQIESINNVTKATEKSAVASAQAAIQRKRDIETARDSQVSYMQAQEQAIKMNDKITDSLNNVSRGHGSNSAAIRESMVLMHELSQGQMKRLGGSLLVLANQLDLVNKAIMFFTANTAATIATVSAMVIGIAAVVAAVIALPVAMIAGAVEQRKMNVAILETGNFAGQTTTSMENLAKTAVETGGSLGVATDAVIELTASGKFAAPAILSIATAIAKTSEAGMESSKNLIKEFDELATMAITSSSRSNDVITKHVLEMNDKYHILNVTQLEHISLLEKTGDAAGAAAEAEKLMAEGMTSRADEMIAKQGYLVKGWHSVTEAISGVWSAMKDLGKEEDTSATAQIQHLVELREATRKHAEMFGVDETNTIKGFNAKILSLSASAKQEQAALQAESDAKILDQRQQHIGRQLETEFRANDKVKKATEDLVEFNERVSVMGIEYEKNHSTEIIKERKRLQDAIAGIKPDKSGDPAKLVRDQRLSALEMEKKDNLEALEEMLNTSKAMGEEDTATRRAQLEDRKAIYEAERINIQASYEKELAALDAYQGKNRASMEDNERKKSEIRNAAKAAQGNLDKRENSDTNSVTKREVADQKELAKQVGVTGKAETERLQKQIIAEQDRLEGMNKTKSAVMELKKVRDEADASALQQANDQLELDILDAATNGDASLADIQLLNQRLTLGKKHLDQKGQLIKLLGEEVVRQKEIEAQDRTTKNLDEALASAKRFQKGMQDAFGAVGKGLGDMAVAFTQFGKDQDTAQKKYNDAKRAGFADEADAVRALTTLNSDKAQAELTGYAGASEAAKSLFSANTKGYQTMAAVSKVFHVAEAAMQAARMIQLGISAVLTQGSGDPYTAFARMAAMAAIVTGLGVAISTSGSGGGGGQTAAQVQAKQGTGSVFGDTTAKSSSISKSLELIQANTGVLIPINSAMLDSLRAIQASMVGLTNLIVRVPGLTGGTNMGIQTGTVAGAGATGTLATAQIGSMIGGALAGPLGVWIGGALGSLVGKLWGKTTQNIVDSGVQLQGLVKDLQSGKGIEQYASVDTTKSSFFGLSKSTSNSVQTQGLSDELNQQFGLIFTNIEDVLKAAAPALGKSSEEVGKAVENFTIPLTKLSLKDLKGDDLTNAINGVISKALDDIAKAAFPGYEKFAKVGEGYSQTLVRVASDVLNVQQVFALLGKSLSSTDANAADIAESLINAAGGLDKLQNATKTFTDSFYTSAQKLAPVQTAVQQRMAELGASSVTTTEQFKDLVLSQNLTTASGQAMYLQLLDIAPAFKQVTDATAAFNKQQRDLQIELLTAQGDTQAAGRAAREDALAELAKVSPEFVKLKQSVYDAQDAMQKANALRSLDIEMLTAQGNTLAVTALNRKIELEVLQQTNPELIAYKQSIYAVLDATQQANAKRGIEIDILNAQGNTLAVTALNREAELKTLQQTNPELLAYKQSLYNILDATQQANAKRALDIEMLNAQGNALAATAMTREDELAALQKTNPELVAYKENIYSVQDAVASASARRSLELNILSATGNELQSSALARQDEVNALMKTNPALVGLKQALVNVQNAADAFKDSMTSVNTAFKVLSASVKVEKDKVDAAFQSNKTDLTRVQALEDKAQAAQHKANIDAIQNESKVAQDAAKSQLDFQKKMNESSISAQQTQIDLITSLLGEIKTSVEATAGYDLAEAHAKALVTVQQASASGSSASFPGITDAVKELAKPTEQLFSSLLEYQTSQAQANNALLDLQKSATGQLTDAQLQLQALQNISASIDASSSSISDTLQSQEQARKDFEDARYAQEQADTLARQQAEQDALAARHTEDIQALDDILTQAQLQIDSLNKIDTSILSLTDAMKSFALSVNNAMALSAAQAAASSVANGMVSNRSSGGYMSTGGVLSIPSFDVGTNEVPEDMLAYIHKDERIIPAADNAELMRRLKSDDEKSSDTDIVTVNNKLDDLIDVVMRGDVANVQKTNDMYRIFRNWDGNGMPPTRSDT